MQTRRNETSDVARGPRQDLRQRRRQPVGGGRAGAGRGFGLGAVIFMWLVVYLGSPPVAEPIVLHDLPEDRVGDARRALRRRSGSARRRASGRGGPAAEQTHNHLGGGWGHRRPPAREQRPDAEQCHVVLQHKPLIAMAGEAHALEDVSRFGVAMTLVNEILTSASS